MTAGDPDNLLPGWRSHKRPGWSSLPARLPIEGSHKPRETARQLHEGKLAVQAGRKRIAVKERVRESILLLRNTDNELSVPPCVSMFVREGLRQVSMPL